LSFSRLLCYHAHGFLVLNASSVGAMWPHIASCSMMVTVGRRPRAMSARSVIPRGTGYRIARSVCSTPQKKETHRRKDQQQFDFSCYSN
jgi:hypothetical protein